MSSMAMASESKVGFGFERIRWMIAALLFLATVINYVDRQVLSLLAPMLRDLFGISATGYSLLSSRSFWRTRSCRPAPAGS